MPDKPPQFYKDRNQILRGKLMTLPRMEWAQVLIDNGIPEASVNPWIRKHIPKYWKGKSTTFHSWTRTSAYCHLSKQSC